MKCRTKSGSLRLYHKGTEYMLDGNGLDLPADLAESIRPHVNVVVGDSPPTPPPPPSEPAEGKRRGGRRSRDGE